MKYGQLHFIIPFLRPHRHYPGREVKANNYIRFFFISLLGIVVPGTGKYTSHISVMKSGPAVYVRKT
ncbi:MAG: hypothetical protein AMJ61_17090 [Desulfobacterales bacterium SG8_35_2]|nr:MAG: hypothetical protein AMJ61_17090 [Desulfobacterales bacterium SG8_35_2]